MTSCPQEKMSSRTNITTENNKLVIKPLQPKKVPILINKSQKLTFLRSDSDVVFRTRNIILPPPRRTFKEDVLYESTPGDFLRLPQYKVVIQNVLNLDNNSSRTIARFTDSNNIVREERTSDRVTSLIGQTNYDIVLSALCSVISQEIKIRAMLALLAIQKTFDDLSCQTENVELFKEQSKQSYEEKCCQTEENCVELLYKSKQKKRIKRTQLTTYVVKDTPEVTKKVVVNPNSVIERDLLKESKPEEVKTTSSIKTEKEQTVLQDLKNMLDEDSKGSVGNISLSALETDNSLLDQPHELMKRIDQHTASARQLTPGQPRHVITLKDGTEITLNVKPEDDFHIATPENLMNLSNEAKMKLLYCQASIDWNYSLVRDEDDNLPIHMAVLNDDVDLLRRQCLMLRNRQVTLDITAGGATALRMAIARNTPASVKCTTMLLQYGADPLHTDDEDRTILHLAAEGSPDHLKAVIDYSRKYARSILQDQEELWTPELENKSPEWLAEHLLDHMCKTVNGQGYTPLMTASRLGKPQSVAQLVAASTRSVNVMMPNCGNTALYLAVGEACMEAADRGNRSKITDNYSKTISILVNSGADASIKNHSGSDVNELLSEANIPELSLLVANKLSSVKLGKTFDESKNCDAYMFEKEKDGTVKIKEIDGSKNLTRKAKADAKTKPIILENIPLEPNTVNMFIQPHTVKDMKQLSPKDKLERHMTDFKPGDNAISTPGTSTVNEINLRSPYTKKMTNVVKAVARSKKQNTLKRVVPGVTVMEMNGEVTTSVSDEVIDSTTVSDKSKAKPGGPAPKRRKTVIKN